MTGGYFDTLSDLAYTHRKTVTRKALREALDIDAHPDDVEA